MCAYIIFIYLFLITSITGQPEGLSTTSASGYIPGKPATCGLQMIRVHSGTAGETAGHEEIPLGELTTQGFLIFKAHMNMPTFYRLLNVFFLLIFYTHLQEM